MSLLKWAIFGLALLPVAEIVVFVWVGREVGFLVAFALCAVEGGRLVRIIEKPTPAQAAAMPGALVSMSCWRMPPSIHDACRAVTRSVRGEFELNDAVNALIDAGLAFEAVTAEDGVLDLSGRGDVAAVQRALAGVTVDP